MGEFILKMSVKTIVASAALASMTLATSALAEVNVVSWGGAYTASQQKGYEPTWTGEKINWINYNGGLGEVRAQVESGNVQWDIVDVLPGQARTGCDKVCLKKSLMSIVCQHQMVCRCLKT